MLSMIVMDAIARHGRDYAMSRNAGVRCGVGAGRAWCAWCAMCCVW